MTRQGSEATHPKSVGYPPEVELLCREHHAQFFAFAYQLVKGMAGDRRELARDMVQEAMFRVCKAFLRNESLRIQRGYVTRAIVSAVLDEARKRRRRVDHFTEPVEDHEAVGAAESTLR